MKNNTIKFTLCTNTTCPLKSLCWRQWAPNSRNVSKGEFNYNPDGTCDYYWPMNEE